MEKLLDSGYVVRCEPVPPYMINPVYERVPQPLFPYIEEQSIAGGSEELPAMEGTPEFQQWQLDMQEWRRRLNTEVRIVRLGVGVIGWKRPDESEFGDTPPEDWEVHPFLTARYDIQTSDDRWERKVQFIQFEIIQTEEDQEWIERQVGLTETSKQSPIKKEEVDAAMTPFSSKEPQDDR